MTFRHIDTLTASAGLTILTIVTLVTGPSALARERAIWSAMKADAAGNESGSTTAVILEGLPDGKSDPEPAHPQLLIKRIAPGCLCCIGNLTLRVTLNRLLRTRPSRIYISIADATHVGRLYNSLSLPPYDAWLIPGEIIAV
ncbi:GTPase [Glaciimonas sp. GG7]